MTKACEQILILKIAWMNSVSLCKMDKLELAYLLGIYAAHKNDTYTKSTIDEQGKGSLCAHDHNRILKTIYERLGAYTRWPHGCMLMPALLSMQIPHSVVVELHFSIWHIKNSLLLPPSLTVLTITWSSDNVCHIAYRTLYAWHCVCRDFQSWGESVHIWQPHWQDNHGKLLAQSRCKEVRTTRYLIRGGSEMFRTKPCPMVQMVSMPMSDSWKKAKFLRNSATCIFGLHLSSIIWIAAFAHFRAYCRVMCYLALLVSFKPLQEYSTVCNTTQHWEASCSESCVQISTGGITSKK